LVLVLIPPQVLRFPDTNPWLDGAMGRKCSEQKARFKKSVIISEKNLNA
jgi:hypothetical protein